MQYRQLGRSSLMVSRVALGCMSLRPGTDDSISIIHRAMDAGINFFDTADLYNGGANEEMLGKALAHKRASVIIATKVGNQLNPDGKGWKWNPSRAYILSAVDESLRRLQTDYIDLYQLHGGTMDDPLDETISAFEQLVQEGKIRYYGLSSIRPNVISYWVEHAHPASVMMQYSLLDRRPEESCLTLLQQNQIGVLARGGLAQGLLAGKKPTAYLDYTAEQVSLLAKSLQQHARHTTPAQTALQFLLHHPAITSAVTGISNSRQLEEIIQAGSLPPLEEDSFSALKNVMDPLVYTDHR